LGNDSIIFKTGIDYDGFLAKPKFDLIVFYENGRRINKEMHLC